MFRTTRLALAGPALFALVACGGGGSSSSQADFNGSSAAGFAAALANEEGDQPTSATLPAWAPDPDGQGLVKTAINLSPLTSSCVTTSAVTVDGNGVSHVTRTYTNCTGPEGGTINGTRDISWVQDPTNPNATDYTFVPHITITNGTRTWVIEGGTRSLVVDKVAKTTTITVRNQTVTLTDSAHPDFSATYTWSRDMQADWSVSGQYKLWGTFTWQNSDSSRGPISGSVSSGDPLIWVTGCCHPESGTVSLTRVESGATATVTFSQPCGTVTAAWGNGNTATFQLSCPS